MASTKAKTGLRTFEPTTTIILGRCYRERKYISPGTAQSSLGRFSLRMAQRLRSPTFLSQRREFTWRMILGSSNRGAILRFLTRFRQSLIENKKTAALEDKTFPLRSTAKRKLKQIDLQFDGRPARTRTEPRYGISLGKDPRPERNIAVLRAVKVCCGRRGWEGAFVSS